MKKNRPHCLKRFERRSASVLLIILLVAGTTQSCTTKKGLIVVEAATTPLNDLNLVQVKIPAVLLEARKAVYAVPQDQSCSSLDKIIRALDDVLAPDLDALVSDTRPGPIERGSNAVGKAAVGTLRRTVEGVVPFRGWVRKLSGAERHSKRIANAITVGMVRRAFVKGLRAAKECS